MSEWVEERRLTWSNLMELCIRQHWYTSGSNDDYEKLCASLCGGRRDLSTDAIIEIAKDIAAHSVGGWEVADIAFEVAGVCHCIFFRGDSPDVPW